MNATEQRHCGFAALIGAPNAGKSTLLNALVGAKVAIVTRKVQTTRSQIRAIAIEGKAQIIFVDTPGIFAPRRTLDTAMVDAAWSGAADADAVALLVDAAGQGTPEKPSRAAEDTARILKGLEEAGRKAILVLNKVDAVRRDTLLALAARLNDAFPFEATFMVSAQTGSGVDDLRAHLAAAMPEGPWLYPEDQLADISERFLAAEVTREALYNRLHDELPYASTVETESWKNFRDGSVRIEQAIFVERDSQKAIVLGKGGRTIKELGQTARAELEEMLERKVHLFLFVKVRERWGEDPERYREMGLTFPGRGKG
jgi:GTP-binding protein Era